VDSQPGPAPIVRWLRAAAVLLLVVAIVVAHRHVDLTDRARLVELRGALASSGVPGLVAFVAGVSVAILLYLPAWPFIGLAVAVHGPWVGALLSLGAAIVAVCVTFGVVRCVGGTPFRATPWAFVNRLLGQLDAAPVRTVFVLRALTGMNAIVNYALALSRISFWQYLAGSAAGLVFPVAWQAWVLSALLR
jgi:uncharacterized membrane protein YdjX (TVP38/TMEM64 family)